jgi:hypothetical protein
LTEDTYFVNIKLPNLLLHIINLYVSIEVRRILSRGQMMREISPAGHKKEKIKRLTGCRDRQRPFVFMRLFKLKLIEQIVK